MHANRSVDGHDKFLSLFPVHVYCTHATVWVRVRLGYLVDDALHVRMRLRFRVPFHRRRRVAAVVAEQFGPLLGRQVEADVVCEAHDELVVLLPQQLLLAREAARVLSCRREPELGLQEPAAARRLRERAGRGLWLLDLHVENTAE